MTVAAVPTGMKRGVSTTPWGVLKRPQRPSVVGQWCVIRKAKGAVGECKGEGRLPASFPTLGGVSLPVLRTPAWLSVMGSSPGMPETVTSPGK